MGFGGISLWSLLLILAIVVLLFGTKKLRHIGTDLGGAIRGFKQAMDEGQTEDRGRRGEESAQISQQDPIEPPSANTEAGKKHSSS